MELNLDISTLPILETRNAKYLNEFINFWSKFYYYNLEQLYNERISKAQFDSDDIQKFYIWKNGMNLSQGKQKSVELNLKSKLTIINRFKANAFIDLKAFNEAFGQMPAVWKIFLLHIIKPNQYPIYDQHIHRAFNYIHGLEYHNISASSLSNKKKEEFYFNKYLTFIEKMGITNLKQMDEAFFSFGQFINSKIYSKPGQWQYRMAKATNIHDLIKQSSVLQTLQNLSTPEECLKYIKEHCQVNSELEKKVRFKRYELLADSYKYNNIIERELLIVLFAYEDVLTQKNHKTTKANRTWQMVKRDGIIKAAEKAVNRNFDPIGYTILLELGLTELTFESIIVKYPNSFPKETLEIARTRLNEAKEYENENL